MTMWTGLRLRSETHEDRGTQVLQNRQIEIGDGFDVTRTQGI